MNKQYVKEVQKRQNRKKSYWCRLNWLQLFRLYVSMAWQETISKLFKEQRKYFYHCRMTVRESPNRYTHSLREITIYCLQAHFFFFVFERSCMIKLYTICLL